jgi:pSer/pThr/pTyr-binding forkhead associated (FHA) protein
MVQLKVLSGKKAGAVWVARRFPVRLGRGRTAHLRLEEDGVWEQHAQIEFNRAEGFVLQAKAEAPGLVNGQHVQRAVLRGGDLIELGSLKLQFWLSDNRQAGLGLREGLAWAAILAVTFGQVALIYWLLQ